ncbi:hypothetical protein HDU93_007433 [Gonapodya sp. JEL0774]|nr:hypothetical protein HDU93_007433 [Gonapodya sp. JEL0774]
MAPIPPLRWKLGSTTITSIPELITDTHPKYFFGSQISPEQVRSMAEKHKWLDENTFVTAEGLLRWNIQALVIDTGEARIVVDTCVGNDKNREEPEWNKLSTDFLDRLEAAGYPPDTITHVVCTHMHVDHVGWNTRLLNGTWVPTFPRARYLFVRSEFEYRERNSEKQDDEIFVDSVKPVHDAGLVDFVGMDHQIVEGVKLEPTTGHTPGHVSVLIETPSGNAVITGDMIHTPVQLVSPRYCPVFDYDVAQSTETRLAAFARWAEGSILFIGTHFSTPTAGIIKKVGDETYELATRDAERFVVGGGGGVAA